MFKAARYLGDVLMSLPGYRARLRTDPLIIGMGHVSTPRGSGWVGYQSLLPLPNHRVDTPEKTHCAFNSGFRPAQLVFNRRGKQYEQPRRVSTKRRDHLVRIDSVAETLRHRFPLVSAFDAVRHHSLRQQSLYRLIELD